MGARYNDLVPHTPAGLEEFKLNQRSSLPLYAQIEAHVLQLIHSQQLQPGQMLPSEHELARGYGVSRLTIRQALGRLVDQGVLTRQRGKGTFVIPPRVAQSLTHLGGFSEDMAARCTAASSKILCLEQAKATKTVAERLGLSPGDAVISIKRLRMADGTPMAVEHAYLAFPGCDRLLKEDLTGSLYELLRARFGIVASYAEQLVDAAIAGRDARSALGITAGSPVFEIRRLTFTQDNRPFEYVESTYRGDKFTLSARLNLRGSSEMVVEYKGISIGLTCAAEAGRDARKRKREVMLIQTRANQVKIRKPHDQRSYRNTIGERQIMSTKRITRRNFLRTTALVGGGAALAACGGAGGGGAAAPAATKAPEAAAATTAPEAAAPAMELPFPVAPEATDPFKLETGVTVDGQFFSGGFGDDYIRYAGQIMELIHPGMKVQVTPLQKVQESCSRASSAGNPPDVIDNSGAGMFKTVDLVNEGQLLDLEELMEAPALDTPGKKFKDTLFPGSQDSGVINGKQYGLNVAYTVSGIWYSKPALRDNWWTYPKTWDDMLALCEQIKKEGKMAPVDLPGQVSLLHVGHRPQPADLQGRRQRACDQPRQPRAERLEGPGGHARRRSDVRAVGQGLHHARHGRPDPHRVAGRMAERQGRCSSRAAAGWRTR